MHSKRWILTKLLYTPMDENEKNTSSNSLEDQSTLVNQDGVTPVQASNNENAPKKKKRNLNPLKLIQRLNIYFLFFILIVLIAALVVYIGYQRDAEDSEQVIVDTQSLTAEELAELSGSDAVIGDPQQLLTIESNAVFSGQVLVRDSLDVAGTIRVGGDLSLPGITVSGTSNFDQIQANNLSIAGDTSIQGSLNVDASITSGGAGTFGGVLSAPSITTDSLQLTGNLQVVRHIETGGPTPNIARAGGVGSGGTVSISGSDTAGTVTINPGSGAGNGPVATITFANAFNQTPHVVVTPIGRYVQYYITRTTTSFTIHIVGSLSTGSFAFDYVAFD